MNTSMATLQSEKIKLENKVKELEKKNKSYKSKEDKKDLKDAIKIAKELLPNLTKNQVGQETGERSKRK